jgi:uncharacterized membrane protein
LWGRATLAAAVVYGLGFGWLALQRHLAGGSHAEDLGFTDQVIFNFLPPRGQWFRMSLYQGATWNTEIDVAHLARPDSLLAFHVEPLLLAFVPLYALGATASLLLVVQAVGVGLGALPAFRLGRWGGGSAAAGAAVAAAYLLAPFGQWAVLSDFHTATLAAPLLLLTVERLVVGRRPGQAIACAGLALLAREDVAPVVLCLGAALLVGSLLHAGSVSPTWRRAGAALALMSLGWIAVCGLVLAHYSGGLSPFGGRYAAALADPPAGLLAALARPTVQVFLATLVGSGAWLGLAAPLFLLPMLPTLAADALSGSAWMASGKAHYSALLLPWVVVGAAVGLRRIRALRRGVPLASALLVVAAGATYLAAGAGPLAANFAPASVTSHARLATGIAASIPADAALSASTSLVPHVSHRARLYLFPAIEDADLVFLDVTATPAPTSAGDVYLRVQQLLASGWSIIRAEDGLLLLARPGTADAQPPPLPSGFFSFTDPDADASAQTPLATYLGGDLELLGATVLPSPDGAVEPDGPRWLLRTTWRARRPLPEHVRPAAVLDLDDGEVRRIDDVAALWWRPPAGWPPGALVRIDFPGVPIRHLIGWRLDVGAPQEL